MTKHIQIKNVADSLHRQLKVRAIENGLSLSDYLKKELVTLASRPTNAEIIARLRALPAIEGDLRTVEYLREDRDNR